MNEPHRHTDQMLQREINLHFLTLSRCDSDRQFRLRGLEVAKIQQQIGVILPRP